MEILKDPSRQQQQHMQRPDAEKFRKEACDWNGKEQREESMQEWAEARSHKACEPQLGAWDFFVVVVGTRV